MSERTRELNRRLKALAPAEMADLRDENERLQSELTSTRDEADRLRGRVAAQIEALQAIKNTAEKAPFSHNMKWIFEHCEDGLRGASTDSWLLRKQAEAVDSVRGYLIRTFPMKGYVKMMHDYTAQEAQHLRTQADELEAGGGDA